MLSLEDLKEQGLTLSKMDAQELHSIISHIAQRGGEVEVVFAGTHHSKKEKAAAPAADGQEQFVQKKLVAADFRKDKTLKEQGFKVGDMYPPIPPAAAPKEEESETKTEQRPVTQEDLDDDPTLSEKGLNVGDVYDFPIVESAAE